MKAKQIISIVTRAKHSRLAEQLKKFEFENEIQTVIVSENAPSCIKKNGTTPARQGWKEYFGELKYAGNQNVASEIWIKNATLGGRRRTWIRALLN